MSKYSDIVQFSRDLYAYNHNIEFCEEDQEHIDSFEFLSSADQILDAFQDAFCQRFGRLFKKYNPKVSDTEEQFFIYTIPRCLKLVDYEHYYFSFMLVAAFIQELVTEFEIERDCYRFAGRGYKCLAAVFKRKFESTFKEEGGWRGLETFIYGYDDRNTQRRHGRVASFLTRGDYAHTRRVLQLIKDCDDVQNESFSLNEYELSLLAVDDQESVEAEIKSILEAFDPPLEFKLDEVADNVSESVTNEEVVYRPFLPNPLNDESSSDNDSLWESSGSGSLIFDSGSEELNSSPEHISMSVVCSKLKSEEALRKSSSDCDASEASSENEPIDSVSESKENDSDELSKRARASWPKLFGKTMSELLCKYCKKPCYEYAKYLVRKHRNRSLKLDEVSRKKL